MRFGRTIILWQWQKKRYNFWDWLCWNGTGRESIKSAAELASACTYSSMALISSFKCLHKRNLTHSSLYIYIELTDYTGLWSARTFVRRSFYKNFSYISIADVLVWKFQRSVQFCSDAWYNTYLGIQIRFSKCLFTTLVLNLKRRDSIGTRVLECIAVPLCICIYFLSLIYISIRIVVILW